MIYALDGQRPQIDPDSWIAPDANLIGRVDIRAGGSVWFGATLRGDNEAIILGEGSNIQENCVLHTDMGFPLEIGANCTGRCAARLCIWGANSLKSHIIPGTKSTGSGLVPSCVSSMIGPPVLRSDRSDTANARMQ